MIRMFAKEFIRFWQAHVSRFAFETAPVLQRTTIVVWNESVTPILPYACRHDLRQEPDEAIPQVRICAGGAERSASLPRPTIRPESSHLPRTRTSHLCFSWHFRGPIRRGQTRDSTRVAVRPAPSTPKQNLCSCRRDVQGVFF